MKIILNRARAESKTVVRNQPFLLFVEASRNTGVGTLETPITLRCNPREFRMTHPKSTIKIVSGSDRFIASIPITLHDGDGKTFAVIDAVITEGGVEQVQSCVLQLEAPR